MTKDEKIEQLNAKVIKLSYNATPENSLERAALDIAIIENELYGMDAYDALEYVRSIFHSYTIYAIYSKDHNATLHTSYNGWLDMPDVKVGLIKGKVGRIHITWGRFDYRRDLVPPELLPVYEEII